MTGILDILCPMPEGNRNADDMGMPSPVSLKKPSMTTDRELIELAAKAAGHVIEGDADKACVQPGKTKEGGLVIANDQGGSSLWNPLKDDGDALRLAVKLRFTLITLSDSIEVNSYDNTQCGQAMTVDGADPYAATRRAIVRAAAEIGKGMK